MSKSPSEIMAHIWALPEGETKEVALSMLGLLCARDGEWDDAFSQFSAHSRDFVVVA